MIRVAIDLTWLRHGVVGGTEAYARNLIEGFEALKDPEITYILFTTVDNTELFRNYKNSPYFQEITIPIRACSKLQRLLWQNLAMRGLMKKNHIRICVEPIYLKPFGREKYIQFITTIHDLQAYHYPEYFSWSRVVWMKAAWRNTVSTSKIIIAISNYVKEDILSKYHVSEDKIKVNYDPVTIDVNALAEEKMLLNFGVEKGGYYYMVTSLLPHKNIDTVLRCLSVLKRRNSAAYLPLIISGVGGSKYNALKHLAAAEGIQDHLILTPFVSVEERNTLYKNCAAFLAPSLFEGFGMPPIEAMLMGVPVVTTRETCSEEITGGLAQYVDFATDSYQWADLLEAGLKVPNSEDVKHLTKKYSKEYVANVFNNIIKSLYDIKE